jgi:hypothetical protein
LNNKNNNNSEIIGVWSSIKKCFLNINNNNNNNNNNNCLTKYSISSNYFECGNDKKYLLNINSLEYQKISEYDEMNKNTEDILKSYPEIFELFKYYDLKKGNF